MENTSKTLLIAGAVFLVILLISLGIYAYNNFGTLATSETNSGVNQMMIVKFNNEYLLYEGRQNGSSVKSLLQCASANNYELYQRQDTIEDCVCIRSKSKDILNKINDLETKSVLSGNRDYGVRYPNYIAKVSSCIEKNKTYNISFNYNSKGYIWEIWINDVS